MLLLKKGGAALVDLTAFLLTIIFTSWLFKKFSIEGLSYEVYLLLSFILSILFPIIILSSTCGENICKVNYENLKGKIRKPLLLIKYTLLYLLYTATVLNIAGFIQHILGAYTYIEVRDSFVFRIWVSLIFLNTICILVTAGGQGFIDFLLEIHAKRKVPLSPLLIIYLFSGSLIAVTFIEYKVSFFDTIKEKIGDAVKSSNDMKFPVEVFDPYTENNQIFYRIEKTSKIITQSDPSSFFFSRYLQQRQIEVVVNEKVLHDKIKRLELCKKLLTVCYDNLGILENNMGVIQTKIIMINIKPYNLLMSVVTYYVYYFDDKAQRGNLNGGYNGDSLMKYYQVMQDKYVAKFSSLIAAKLQVRKSVVKEHIEKGTLPGLLKDLHKTPADIVFQLDLDSIIDFRILNIPLIPFDSVKPTGYFSFNFPTYEIPLFRDRFFENEKFITALEYKSLYVLSPY